MDKTTYPRIKKISPQLIVRDIARSIAFYTEILGFELDFRYEDFYAGMIKDDHSIHLKSGTPSTEERKNKRKNEDLDLVFSVDGIEALFIQLLNNPVEIIQPLRNMPYGKEFYLVDPDGYIISFLEEA